MKVLNKSMNQMKNIGNMKTIEILFIVLLVLFLISGVNVPYNLTPYVNNVFMYGSLVALVILLFLNNKYALAIIFAVAAFVLINRSSKISHQVMKPSTQNKNNTLNNLNTHLTKTSLEEEVVGSMNKKPDNIPGPSSYQPVLCSSSHSASDIN